MRTLALTFALLVAILPRDARADDTVGVPVVRLAMGPGIFFEPTEPRFKLDLTAGFIGITEDGLAFGGELGYSFDTTTLHAFNLAGAIGFGTPLLAVTYRPRLIAGTISPFGQLPEASIGMRNSLMMHVLADIFSFEVGHQFESAPNGLQHDIPIMFGFNPAGVIYILTAVGDALR